MSARKKGLEEAVGIERQQRQDDAEAKQVDENDQKDDKEGRFSALAPWKRFGSWRLDFGCWSRHRRLDPFGVGGGSCRKSNGLGKEKDIKRDFQRLKSAKRPPCRAAENA